MKKQDKHALETAISWLIFSIIISFCNACLNYSAYYYYNAYCCCDHYYHNLRTLPTTLSGAGYWILDVR